MEVPDQWTGEPGVVGLFADLVSRDDGDISLPAAALAVARAQYPHLDVAAHLAILDSMRSQAAARVAGTPDAGAVAALNAVVFDELGFSGNRTDYYDPRNSYLNEVLERRLGIPITLALIYMELGRAAGLELEGVGFPGHFLVRNRASGELLDVFQSGRIVEPAECHRLLERQRMAASWRDDFLEGVSSRQMLTRMLNNLRRHYAEIEDRERLSVFHAMAAVLEDDEMPQRLGRLVN